MSKELAVDPVFLREEVKSKYRDVAINPSGEYHFHTGRPLARRLVMIRRWLTRCQTRQSSRSPGWQIRFHCDPWSKAKGSWTLDRRGV